MDQFEGDPGLHQGLVPAQGGVLEVFRGPRAAGEPRGLLRVDDRDPRQGSLVAQVGLGAVAPSVEVLEGLSHRRS